MSRKHGQPKQIGKRQHGGRAKKVKKQDIIAALMRRTKRDFIARGIIQDPANRAPRFSFSWSYGNLNGVVYADDRSTARAMIKRDLGIRKKNRLPVEVEITREHNLESDPEGEPTEEDEEADVCQTSEMLA